MIKTINRHFDIVRADIDEKNRKVPVSFSSESVIDRGYYKILLMHNPENVDLSILEAGGSLLLNHNPDVVLGRVENPRIEDLKGRADIIFDTDAVSEIWFQKVLSGSVTGISVGANAVTQDDRLDIGSGTYEYRPGKFISGPAEIYTHWRPGEISLTPIPADRSVGTNQTENEEERMELKDVIKGLAGSDEFKTLISQTVNDAVKLTMEALKPDEKTLVVDDEVTPDALINNAELIKRAGIVSVQCKSEVTDMILNEKSEIEISNHIINSAMSEKKTELNLTDDNSNKANMDDDVFINGFKI